MAPDGENFRSAFAIKEIEQENNYDLDKLIQLGYNNYLSIFDSVLPRLIHSYDELSAAGYYAELKEVVDTLRNWDRRSSVESVATTIAIEWLNYIIVSGSRTAHTKSNSQMEEVAYYLKSASTLNQIQMLAQVTEGLKNSFSTWKVKWGVVNRYQRPGRTHEFDDDKPSLAVRLASAYYGSLPAFEVAWGRSNRSYGIAGNSFVAAVEFDEKVRARSITTGGQSFDPASKHFDDQAAMFLEGKFKDVLFYKEDVLKNAERSYHPGE
jgi:acyl-homoserine lactone acylase PvdQ